MTGPIGFVAGVDQREMVGFSYFSALAAGLLRRHSTRHVEQQAPTDIKPTAFTMTGTA